MGVEVVKTPSRKMQKARIEGERFGILPLRIIEHPELSDSAKLTLAWAQAHGANWDFYIFDLKRKLRFGNTKWARVSKELKESGFLRQSRKFGDWDVVFNLEGKEK